MKYFIILLLFISCSKVVIKKQNTDSLKSEIEKVLINYEKKKNLEVENILEMKISDLAKLIRDKQITSAELTALYISRSFKLNSKYNAIVTYNLEAIKNAKRLDQLLSEGKIVGKLHGVPFTIKDTYSTKNLKTTAGSIDFINYVPTNNAVIVDRLLSEGAVLIGKTNTPSMAMDIQTTNNVFGTTQNAVQAGYTSGGSSGGAAVAVAKRFSPFDIGSDIAGSIRIPAAYNGIYGYRPTLGLLSMRGHNPPGEENINGIRHMAVPGPLAKSVDDIEFLMNILSAPNKYDRSLIPMSPKKRANLKISDLKIAWTDEFAGITADPSIQEAMKKFLQRLKNQGAEIEKNSPQNFPYEKAWESWGAILGHQGNYDISNFKRWIGDLFTKSSVASMPTQRKIIGPISVKSYMQNLSIQDDCIDQLENFLDPYDIWIVPVSATTVFKHITPDSYFGEFPVYEKPIYVDGKPLAYWVATISYTTIFSFTESPVITIPIGKDTNGLPIGIQIVGKRFSDLELIQIAKMIDRI